MRFRPTGSDLLLSRSRYIAINAPLVMPPIHVVREAMRAIGAAGPHTRLGIQPDPARRTWNVDHGADFGDLVRPIEPHLAALDPAELVTELRNAPGERPPMTVHVGPTQLVIDVHHGLGDALIFKELSAAIFAYARDVESEWVNTRDSPRPAMAATWHTFIRRPRGIADALRVARTIGGPQPAPDVIDAEQVGANRDGEPQARRGLRICQIDRQVDAEVNRWRKSHAPGVSTASLWAYLIYQAAVRADIDLLPSIRVAVDCRRYLPPGRRYNGNFAAGLIVAMNENDTVADVGDRIEKLTSSGAPLLALVGVGGLVLMYPKLNSHKGMPTTTGVSLLISDVGRMPDDDVSWASDDHRCYAALLDPADASSVSVLNASVGGCRTVSISFFEGVLDQQIDSMAALLADPIALLRATV